MSTQSSLEPNTLKALGKEKETRHCIKKKKNWPSVVTFSTRF